MYLSNQQQELINQERIRALQAAAENDRLAQLAQKTQPNSRSLYTRMLQTVRKQWSVNSESVGDFVPNNLAVESQS